jgi:hypothetical protein
MSLNASFVHLFAFYYQYLHLDDVILPWYRKCRFVNIAVSVEIVAGLPR